MMRQNMLTLAALLTGFQLAANADVDSTKANERERYSYFEPSSETQDVEFHDMNLTNQIRQDILRDKDFSSYARNVKIITVNGKVTLRGPVLSDFEHIMIERYARRAVGARNVFNELLVLNLDDE